MTSATAQAPHRRVSPQERWGAAAAPCLAAAPTIAPTTPTEVLRGFLPVHHRKRGRVRPTAAESRAAVGRLLCELVGASDRPSDLLGALTGLAIATKSNGAANVLRRLLTSTREAAAADLARYAAAVELIAPHAPPSLVRATLAPLYALVMELRGRKLIGWTLSAPPATVDDPEIIRAREIQACLTSLDRVRAAHDDVRRQRERIESGGHDVSCPTCAQQMEPAARIGVLEVLAGAEDEANVDATYYTRRLAQLGATAPVMPPPPVGTLDPDEGQTFDESAFAGAGLRLADDAEGSGETFPLENDQCPWGDRDDECDELPGPEGW